MFLLLLSICSDYLKLSGLCRFLSAPNGCQEKKFPLQDLGYYGGKGSGSSLPDDTPGQIDRDVLKKAEG